MYLKEWEVFCCILSCQEKLAVYFVRRWGGARDYERFRQDQSFFSISYLRLMRRGLRLIKAHIQNCLKVIEADKGKDYQKSYKCNKNFRLVFYVKKIEKNQIGEPETGCRRILSNTKEIYASCLIYSNSIYAYTQPEIYV